MDLLGLAIEAHEKAEAFRKDGKRKAAARIKTEARQDLVELLNEAGIIEAAGYQGKEALAPFYVWFPFVDDAAELDPDTEPGYGQYCAATIEIASYKFGLRGGTYGSAGRSWKGSLYLIRPSGNVWGNNYAEEWYGPVHSMEGLGRWAKVLAAGGPPAAVYPQLDYKGDAPTIVSATVSPDGKTLNIKAKDSILGFDMPSHTFDGMPVMEAARKTCEAAGIRLPWPLNNEANAHFIEADALKAAALICPEMAVALKTAATLYLVRAYTSLTARACGTTQAADYDCEQWDRDAEKLLELSHVLFGTEE